MKWLIGTLIALALPPAIFYIWLIVRVWRGDARSIPNFWANHQQAWSTAQSLFTILAILIGGGWAVYTWSTQWMDHQEEARRAREEARTGRTAAIQVEISARQTRPPQVHGLFIAGDITIKNVGTRSEKLPLNDGPLFVAMVTSIPYGTVESREADQKSTEPCNEGHVTLEQPAKRFWLSRPQVENRPEIELGDELRPGATDVFHFLLRVTQPGTYALMASLNDPNDPDPEPEEPFFDPCLGREGRYRNRWESPASFVAVR